MYNRTSKLFEDVQLTQFVSETNISHSHPKSDGENLPDLQMD